MPKESDLHILNSKNKWTEIVMSLDKIIYLPQNLAQ